MSKLTRLNPQSFIRVIFLTQMEAWSPRKEIHSLEKKRLSRCSRLSYVSATHQWKGVKCVYMFTDQAYDVWGWDTSDMAGHIRSEGDEKWTPRPQNVPLTWGRKDMFFNEMSQSHRGPASPVQNYDDPYFVPMEKHFTTLLIPTPYHAISCSCAQTQSMIFRLFSYTKPMHFDYS